MSDSSSPNGSNDLTHGLTSLQLQALGLSKQGPSIDPRRSPKGGQGGQQSPPLPMPLVHQNVLSHFCTHRLLSPDRVERHYSFLLTMLIASTVLFALLKTQGPVFLWGSPMCTLWATAIVVATLGNVWAEQRERWVIFELARLAQFLLCMLSVLIYYDGSNVINRFRYEKRGDAMLYDETLLQMDEALFGWLWPKGQMALWLDTQPSFGATTQIGRIYAEVFQILYVSYYFWGNAIGVILAFKYFWYSVYKKNKGTKKRLQWRCIQMFVSAWVGGFVFNHLINLCFPAVSPRIYLAEHYQNELRGVWVLSSMRNAITNAAANTFSAFPSGHCGLSILAVLLAFRIQLSRAYTWAVGISTVLIVLATQVLRYHYFVDFAFSSIVVAFGAWLGGFHDSDLYQRSLTEMGLEDTDEEGKYMLSATSEGGYARESVPLMGLSGRGGEDGSSSTRGGDRQRDAHRMQEDEEMGLHHDEDRDRRGNASHSPPLVLSAGVFGLGITRSLSSQKLGGQKSGDGQLSNEEAV